MTSWSPWIPARGDVVSVRMAAPEAGVSTNDDDAPERRPALVLSPAAYNEKLGLALVCPIAGRAQGYPFEVAVPRGLPVSGVVLADRVTSLDWRSLGVRHACAVPDEVVTRVLDRLLPLVGERRRRR